MKLNSRQKRLLRVRKKIKRNQAQPRLVVFRSCKYFYSQIVDKNGKVLASACYKDIPASQTKITKTQQAEMVGKQLAKKALAKKISQVVFDRGAYKYHGRVKAFAESARAAGLKF